MATTTTTTRPLYLIAAEIHATWGNRISYAAKPYLNAMLTLDSIEDTYYCDSADMIVRYFLSNATGWKGDDARRLKAELKAMLKPSRKR